MKKIISHIAVCAVLVLFFSINSFAETSKNLFKIERSKNANIVQYDIILDENGKIDSKKTIDAYWILYAVDGSRKELCAFDKKAYGYQISYNSQNYYDLTLKAVEDRKIKVIMVDGEPKAEIPINQKRAYLTKVYVSSVERWTGIPKVIYYTLTGIDIETGEEVVEKIDIE